MKAIQLHDQSQELIGTVLVTNKNSEGNICHAWDGYITTTDDADIWEFVSIFPTMDMEVVDMEFYQPR